MKTERLFEISRNFDIEGEPSEIKVIESGHINKTYLVKYTTGKDYILQ